MDSSAYTIAIVGYSIVFAALLVLWLIFANLPKLLSMHIRLKFKRKKEMAKIMIKAANIFPDRKMLP